MLLFKTALRTLVRNKRRTGITTLSIAMSLAILFWLQSVMEARSDYLIDKVLSIAGGDVQVFKKVYSEDKRLADVMTAPLPDLTAATGPEAVQTDRIRLPGLIAAAEESFPFFLNGIDPVNEPKASRIKDFLVKGEFLAPDLEGNCADKPIYIGQKLAQLLRVDVGDKVVFLGQAADGTLGNELFRVKGIYDSRTGDFDKVFAFTTLSCTKRVGVLNGIHEVAFRVKHPGDIDRIETEMNKLLPPDLVAIGWKQANPMIAQVLRFNDGIIAMLTFIMVAIVIFGTINTLLMSVHERSREFGVMLALGMQPIQLMTIIVIEAFLMAVTGFVFAFILGGIAIAYHKWHGFDLTIFIGQSNSFQGMMLDTSIVFPVYAFGPFIRASLIMIFFVTLAGLFPAYRAGKLTPVDTIRG
jgi:putative ABC transport system permease protein